MTTPARIQRRRTKGWRKPENAVIVDRTSRWGNPFTVADCLDAGFAETVPDARRVCTEQFRDWLIGDMVLGTGEEDTPWSAERRRWFLDHAPELAGRDLMCWCPLPEPGQPDHCHAAVLLELANAPAEVTR
jgi:uncharacterized protein DUF4326